MKHCRVLDERDHDLVARLVAADPVTHCFLASRLEAGVLHAAVFGELWGYPIHRPYAVAHVGANLVTAGMDAEAQDAFIEDLGRRRPFVAMVGPADETLGMWRKLCRRWGDAYRRVRLIRERQLLMATDQYSPVAPDPLVTRVTEEQFPAYYMAAAAMYTEELEEDPRISNPIGYRAYVRSLIDQGRAFAVFHEGEVVFKADLGAVGAGVAQVQGVWVARRARGRGLSVPAMATVTNAIIDQRLIASLYVNDFNAPAVASYRHCGYQEVGALASVLY